jgi:hypothetical protein
MEILYLFYVVVKLSLPLREEHRLGGGGRSRRRVLRKIFGPKTEKVKGY